VPQFPHLHTKTNGLILCCSPARALGSD